MQATNSKARFPLGQVVATPGALDLMARVAKPQRSSLPATVNAIGVKCARRTGN